MEPDFNFEQVSLDDAVEYGTAPQGSIARLVVTSVRVLSETSFMVVHEIAELEDHADVGMLGEVVKFINYPEAKDDARAANRKKLDAKKYFVAFLGKVPKNCDDLIGTEHWCVLSEKLVNDELRNNIARNGYIMPK